MALRKIEKDASGVPTGNYTLEAGGTLWADSPIGTILAYGGTTSPAGWMICDGSSLLRASYPELFAVIGTAFGSGDGSTTFNLPDMRDRAVMGVADGGILGESQDSQNKAHTHTWSNTHNHSITCGDQKDGYSRPFIGGVGSATTVSTGNKTISGTTSSDGGTDARPKNVRCNYIIKAKMVALPADFMDKVEEAITQQIEIKDVALATDTRQQIAAGGEGNVYSITYTLAQGEKVVGITNLDAGNGWGASEVSFKFFGIDIVSDGVIRLRATVKNLSNDAKSIGCSGHITTIKV